MIGHRPPVQGELFLYQEEIPQTAAREKLLAVSAAVDFEPVRELVAPYFAAWGKPSVDPVLMVKMLLLGALFGIESYTDLVEQCADRLSFREFLGLAGNEAPPARSNFSNWTKRLGADWLQALLVEVLQQCAAHGLVPSRVRAVDATDVKARADRQGETLVVEREQVGAYVAAMLDGETVYPPAEPPADPVVLSGHDPEARLQKKGRKPSEFRYQTSFSSCPETGLVCSVIVKPLESAGTLAEHVAEDPFEVDEVVADSLYDAGEALAATQAQGVRTFVPLKGRQQRGKYAKDQFVYAKDADLYRCPAGRILKRLGGPNAAGETQYRAAVSDCAHCPLKPWCTAGQSRTITRCAGEEAREATVREGAEYRLRMRQRRIAEHLNRLAKRDHGLTRARGLGLGSMTVQAVMVAMAINLNKLLRHLARQPRRDQGGLALREAVGQAARAACRSVLWAYLTAFRRRRGHLLKAVGRFLAQSGDNRSARPASARRFGCAAAGGGI